MKIFQIKTVRKKNYFLEKPIDKSKHTVDTLLTIFIMDIYKKVVIDDNIKYEYLK